MNEPQDKFLQELLAQTATVTVPNGFAERATIAVKRDIRFRKNMKIAGMATAGLAVILAVGSFMFETPKQKVNEQYVMAAPVNPGHELVAQYSRMAAEEMAGPIASVPSSISLPHADVSLLATGWAKPARDAMAPLTTGSAHAVDKVLMYLNQGKSGM